jgi:hypothetical protein
MFFNKKKATNGAETTPTGINEIGNTQLKESIGNSAISLLEKGTDYTELDYLKVEFGYLFGFPDGVQSLLKVYTDKTTAFFAVQKNSLMRIAIDDNLFETYKTSFSEKYGA